MRLNQNNTIVNVISAYCGRCSVAGIDWVELSSVTLRLKRFVTWFMGGRFPMMSGNCPAPIASSWLTHTGMRPFQRVFQNVWPQPEMGGLMQGLQGLLSQLPARVILAQSPVGQSRMLLLAPCDVDPGLVFPIDQVTGSERASGSIASCR